MDHLQGYVHISSGAAAIVRIEGKAGIAVLVGIQAGL